MAGCYRPRPVITGYGRSSLILVIFLIVFDRFSAKR
jgi:hypothetical protein